MRKRWPWMLAVLAALGLMAGTLWIRTGVAGRDYGIPAEEIEAGDRRPSAAVKQQGEGQAPGKNVERMKRYLADSRKKEGERRGS